MSSPEGPYGPPQPPYQGSYGPPPQPGDGQQAPAPQGQQPANPYGQAPYGGGAQQPYGAQPGYGQQPYGGAPSFGAPSAPRRRRLPLILGGVGLLVVVVVLVLGFLAPGFFVTKVFDQTAIQDGVQKILTDDGLDVSAVRCPAEQEVTTGAVFTCTATIGGSDTQVTATVTDDSGTYEVARP